MVDGKSRPSSKTEMEHGKPKWRITVEELQDNLDEQGTYLEGIYCIVQQMGQVKT